MTDRWVDTSLGDDGTGDGTGDKPYKTIAAGFAAAVAGDTVRVRSGTYRETVSFTGKDNITLKGEGLTSPLMYGGVPLTGNWKLTAGTTKIWEQPLAADPLTLIFRNKDGSFTKGWRADAAGQLIGLTACGVQFYYDAVALKIQVWCNDNPAYVYNSVDVPTLQGTASAYAAAAKGGLFASNSDNFAIRYFRVFGYAVNGILLDDCNDHTEDDVISAFNAEDGTGGFGCVSPIHRTGVYSWNGWRRALNLGEIWTDGDGVSYHLGAVESTGILIEDCYFESNTKDATQNIHGSSCTMQRCIITNCNFNIIVNIATGTPEHVFRNVEVRGTLFDVGGIGISGTAIPKLYNCAFIGVHAATAVGITQLSSAGTTMQNCIVTGWVTDALIVGGTFTHSHNNFYDNDVNNIVLGVGESQSNPNLYVSNTGAYEIRHDSILAGAGIDLSGTGFTTDMRGVTRPSGAWSIGPYEPRKHGGLLVVPQFMLEEHLAWLLGPNK